MRKGIIVAIGIILGTAGAGQAQDPDGGIRLSPPDGVLGPSWVTTGDDPPPIAADPPAPTAYRVWGQLDYLAWWIKGANTPPLLSAGPASSAGVLGRPGTAVLFGGSDLDLQDRAGVRALLGVWIDSEQTLGIEGSYFFLGDRSVSQGVNNPPGIITARPFFNVNTNAEDSQLVSVPGRLNGQAFASYTSSLDGYELNGVVNFCGCSCNRLEAIAGFRYVSLREGLGVTENLQVLGSPTEVVGGGNHFVVEDSFTTANRFYGGQVGLRGELGLGRWSLGGSGKIALGCTDEIVTIQGTTLVTPAGQPTTAHAGGLLALPSNIGNYNRTAFAVVPEIGVNISYALTDHIRLRAGYTFLYWSDVVRSGDQIDRGINVNQIPATGASGAVATRPQFQFHSTDFFAHGVNLGVEIRY